MTVPELPYVRFVIKRGLTAFDGLPDGVQQHVVAKWFREKLDGARLNGPDSHRHVTVTGDEDYGHIDPVRRDALLEIQTVEVRQVVALGWWLCLRRRLFETVWFLRLCQCAAPLGFVAVLAGWTVTEVGRQPWTVYGLLRTAQSVTPSLTGTDVAWSLLAYMAVYLTMYPAGIAVMARIIRQGPLAPPSDASATIAHAHSTFNVPVEQQS